MAMAFALTLTGGNAQAVTFPSAPLQTVAEFPPPNVQFILDDSGSMGWVSMPADILDGDLEDTIFDKSSVHNTLYYNPATSYKGWLQHDGSRDLSGTSYTRAWGNVAFLTDEVDLSDDDQVYFVLKSTPPKLTDDLSDVALYYRYTFVTGSPVQLQKSQFSNASNLSGYPISGLNNNSGMLAVGTFTLPAGLSQIVISSTGGDHGNNGGCNNGKGNGADLYLRLGAAPTTGTYDNRSRNGGNSESITVNSPGAGEWHIGLNSASCFKSVTVTVAKPAGWEELSLTTATTTELSNYATWYSYHRSRMKTAKAGASEAFGGLTENVRVGFDTINRNTTGLPFAIPVNGVFSNANATNNKKNWYDKLFAASPGGFTPLRRALQRAGESLKDTSSSGPWGPESGTSQVTCRQNFAILTTDGFWNTDQFDSKFEAGFSPVGDTDNTEADNSVGGKHTPDGVKPIQFVPDVDYTGYVVENPFKDNFITSPNTKANTLADVAMAYWKNDLRTDLGNNVPPSNSDPAYWQHMVTFGVSIGLKGVLDPATELPKLTAGSSHWPDPITNTGAARIDDLWHASVNGRGKFVVASNSETFRKGLQDAFEVIAQKQGTGSGLAASSTSFKDDTRLFQASFTTKAWTGELVARSATKENIGPILWNASTGIPAAASRNILTWSGTGGAVFPTSAQTSALDQSTRALSPVNGANNVAYIRGNQSLEGSDPGKGLRVRNSLLGDIVNSSPLFINGLNTIFIGANDGMLHAINSNDGKERFAYIPGGVNLSSLASLSDPFYSHKFFVDGPVTASTDSQTPGKTILVGALGRGGKGVFALDVTNPASMGSTNVLWELGSELVPDVNLGNVLGEPLVGKLNDANKTPVVIFGNGPNSSAGTAVLYVVKLEGVDAGKVLFKLDTQAGVDNALMGPRLANLDKDPNGTVDAVYAGDLKGNLWKFDFSKAQFDTSSAPAIALNGTPFFKTGTGQAITSAVQPASDPDGKPWVFFGTGSFMSTSDLTDNTVQAIYGVRDYNVSSTLTLSDLQQRAIVAVSKDGSKRAFTQHETLDPSKDGWYIELGKPLAGERVISRPEVDNGNVLTVISLIPISGKACEASGTGFINSFDAFTGTSTEKPVFPGSGGTFSDADDKTNNTSSQRIGGLPGGGHVSIDGSIYVPATCPGGVCIDKFEVTPPPGLSQRASWREVIDN